MKLLRITLSDIRFQWKYGFYLLYAVFTLFYLLVLLAVPKSAVPVIAAVMIYTDPAAMGLFFMGAIVLLEKSQHADCALGVSPLSPDEYLLGKLISFAVIGELVGGVLAAASAVPSPLMCLYAIAFMSFFCSACGFIAAQRSRSLNSFVLLAVPFELFVCLPPALLFFGISDPLLMLHPGVAAVWLILGGAPNTVLCALSLFFWSIAAVLLCRKSAIRYFCNQGGK